MNQKIWRTGYFPLQIRPYDMKCHHKMFWF